MKRFKHYIKEEFEPHTGVMYHGTPSGDLRGGTTGLHLGTKRAAEQALHARIGFPADGSWDGKREYGKTKLAGKTTLKNNPQRFGEYPLSGHNTNAPDHDYYPHEHPDGMPKFSDNEHMKSEHKPEIGAYKIKGKMSNTIHSPHPDFKANGYMKASLKKGNAKRGFYYKNEGEDSGSVSVTVPGPSHVERVKD